MTCSKTHAQTQAPKTASRKCVASINFPSAVSPDQASNVSMVDSKWRHSGAGDVNHKCFIAKTGKYDLRDTGGTFGLTYGNSKWEIANIVDNR